MSSRSRRLNIRWVAEECAERHLELYPEAVKRVSLEEEVPRGPYWGGSRIDVYVKSIGDLSLDEYPIIEGIIRGARGVRLEFFEYESLEQEMPRHMVLSRLLERSYKRRVPSLILMPSALPVALVESLSEELEELLDESLAARIRVHYSNRLYLPEPGEVDSITLVAKENSESAYERVSWLGKRAREYGLEVRRTVFLPDNRMIFDYVYTGEPRSFLYRVPVNRLALYTTVIADCASELTEGFPILRLERLEESSHLLYSLGVDPELLGSILLAISGFRGGHPSGLLYTLLKRGVTLSYMRVLERITG